MAAKRPSSTRMSWSGAVWAEVLPGCPVAMWALVNRVLVVMVCSFLLPCRRLPVCAGRYDESGS